MTVTLGTWRRLKDLEFKVILRNLMRSCLVDGCGGERSGVEEEEGKKHLPLGVHMEIYL